MKENMLLSEESSGERLKSESLVATALHLACSTAIVVVVEALLYCEPMSIDKTSRGNWRRCTSLNDNRDCYTYVHCFTTCLLFHRRLCILYDSYWMPHRSESTVNAIAMDYERRARPNMKCNDEFCIRQRWLGCWRQLIRFCAQFDTNALYHKCCVGRICGDDVGKSVIVIRELEINR